jgi:two-component system OmpR family response regulator
MMQSPAHASLLLIEDDADLRLELSDYLSASGYAVTTAASVWEAEAALGTHFDLLVVDINLPDGSGLELCRRMRSYIRAGIVMCTGLSDRNARIASLKAGADAYLVKPVDPEELDATLTNLHRRLTSRRSSMLLPAPLPTLWRMDQVRQTLTGPNGRALELNHSEALLLSCVLRSPEQQATREVIFAEFEAAGMPTDGRKLEVLVSRLRIKARQKLAVKLPFQSVYGRGYIFTDHSELI